jgi:hypothetical protein
MKKLALLAVVCSLGLGLSLHSTQIFAQPADDEESVSMDAKEKLPYPEARKKLRSMDPQQKRAIRKEAKEKWDKLSPEEKQAFENKVKEHVERIHKRKMEECEKIRQGKDDKVLIRLYTLEILNQDAAKK